jgi:F-type H+-transporting ATPase subunit a
MKHRRLGPLGIWTLALTALSSVAFAAEEGGEERPASWLNWLYSVKAGGHPIAETPADVAIAWALLLVLVLVVAAVIGRRRIALQPGPFQMTLEMAYGALKNVIEGVMGEDGEAFLPFIGSLFIYVFLMNLMGVIPGLFSPTANLSITAALAVVIFLVVQFYGLKQHGVGYLKHFLEGLPSAPAFLIMAPLVFAIHVVGELVRPVSLALRLFGNIHGEETVVVTLVGLVAATHLWFLPIQLPNLALGLLTAFVQALVMALLAAVYLSGVLAHEPEAEHG